MSKIETRKETRLETAPIHEIGAVLDFKLQSASPEIVADYIALSIQNLDDKLTRIKEAESQMKSLKSEIALQIETIKNGSAKWLHECGINKLQGIYVSSISISSTKPKETLKVINEDSLINQGYFKTTVDLTAVKNAIKDGVNVEGAEIEVIHCEDSLRVNQRKKSDEN